MKSEKKNDSHLLVKMKQHLRLACWVVVVGAVFQFVTTTEVLNYQIVAYDCHDSTETQVALPPVHWNFVGGEHMDPASRIRLVSPRKNP